MKTYFLNSLAFLIIIVLIPKYNFGQAPNLGSVANFGLFTSVGAIDNIGPTYISDNIGTNVGAFTGFPPGEIVGETHVADAISLQAALDLESAYNEILAIAFDSAIGSVLGNNQILVPNVYFIGAASTLNGILTLDGQDNPDALFIFKIDGAFLTSHFSKIILINSASLYNVYWQINGIFDLGDSSIFQGTVITNGAINLLEGSSISGRGLSRAGAISLNNTKVTIGIIPLPIELLNFNAFSEDNNVRLNWSTATETNNNFFTIQHSKDKFSYSEVTRLEGAGNSNYIINYSIIDKNPYKEVSYYRLMQTDFDGTYSYSNIIKIDLPSYFSFNIYPNPFSKMLNIEMNADNIFEKTELRFYNVLGFEVSCINLTEQSTSIETSNLVSGIYFYKITRNNEVVQSGRLVSNRKLF